MIGRCHQGGIDDGRFPPTKISWSALQLIQRDVVCSDSPKIRSLLNKLLFVFHRKFRRSHMLLYRNGLIAKEGPYVVITPAFWYLGDLVYCDKYDILYIYTLHMSTLAEHLFEE